MRVQHTAPEHHFFGRATSGRAPRRGRARGLGGLFLVLAVALCALLGSPGAQPSLAAQPPLCPPTQQGGAAGPCAVTRVAPHVVANCPAFTLGTVNVNSEVENSLNLIAGQPVTFDACATPSAPTSTITFITFDFGDGTAQSYAPTPPVAQGSPAGIQITHTYLSAGTYTVKVAAQDSLFMMGAAPPLVITVNVAPVLSVTLQVTTPPPLVVNQPVTFTATATPSAGRTITGFTFDFGDGSPAQFVASNAAGTATVTATHPYAAPGSYTATVTATDSSGATVSASVTLRIALQVTLQVVTSGPLAAGQPVTFKATATPTTGQTITGFSFNFGDGSPDQFVSPSTGSPATATVTHVYVAPGSYTVVVTATDSSGATGTASTTIGIGGNGPPCTGAPVCVSLQASTLTAQAGSPVQFTARAITSNAGKVIVTFTFDFGDGSPPEPVPASPQAADTTITVSHTFERPDDCKTATGTCTVSVTATDSSGATGTATVTIAVVTAGQQPTVTIQPATATAAVGQSVAFTATATPVNTNATIATITLDCDNGTPLQTATNMDTAAFSCTYAAPGAYTVTATATDSSGAPAGQATATVTVVPLAPASPPCSSGSATQTGGAQTTGSADQSVGQLPPPNTGFANANGPYKTFGTQPITFSAAGSQPEPGHVITAYLFNFGDSTENTFVATTSPTITHSYAASYTYTVTLLVVSECQLRDAQGNLEVDPTTGAPVVDIQIASANTIAVVYPPLPNCYPPTGAGPFGPGQCASVLVSCSASLTQACALPPGCGVGQVVGTCSVPSSCTGPIAGSACVTPCPPDALSPPILATVCPQVPPTAASPVTVSAGGPYQGVAGAPILFSATASGSVASNVCTDGSNYGLPGLACTTLVSPANAGSYLWQFGDGTSATGQAVSHTYAAAGTYNVSVTLSLGSPGLFTAQTTVTVAGSQ